MPRTPELDAELDKVIDELAEESLKWGERGHISRMANLENRRKEVIRLIADNGTMGDLLSALMETGASLNLSAKYDLKFAESHDIINVAWFAKDYERPVVVKTKQTRRVWTRKLQLFGWSVICTERANKNEIAFFMEATRKSSIQ